MVRWATRPGFIATVFYTTNSGHEKRRSYVDMDIRSSCDYRRSNPFPGSGRCAANCLRQRAGLFRNERGQRSHAPSDCEWRHSIMLRFARARDGRCPPLGCPHSVEGHGAICTACAARRVKVDAESGLRRQAAEESMLVRQHQLPARIGCSPVLRD